MSTRTRVRHELVISGIAIMGIAYTPVAHKKATAEVMATYIQHKEYNPMKWANDWNISEARKAALQKIHNIRHEIRNEVRKIQADRNTRVYTKSAQQVDRFQIPVLTNKLMWAITNPVKGKYIEGGKVVNCNV